MIGHPSRVGLPKLRKERGGGAMQPGKSLQDRNVCTTEHTKSTADVRGTNDASPRSSDAFLEHKGGGGLKDRFHRLSLENFNRNVKV